MFLSAWFLIPGETLFEHYVCAHDIVVDGRNYLIGQSLCGADRRAVATEPHMWGRHALCTRCEYLASKVKDGQE